MSLAKGIASSPYRFPKPILAELIPFSKEQLESYRKKGVVRIERITELCPGDTTKKVYYLNNEGKIVREQYFNNSEITGNCYYKYDSSGSLLIKKLKTPFEYGYDSLTYDSLGRIASYYSSYLDDYNAQMKSMNLKPFKEKREPKIKNFQLTKSTNTFVILSNEEFGSEVFYTLNNNNEIIKVKNGLKTDSVHIESTFEGKQTISYFYTRGISGYPTIYTGLIKTIVNNLIESETIFNTSSYSIRNGQSIAKRHSIKKYFYNEKSRLLRIEEGIPYLNNEFLTYSTVFFTYNYNGFIKEKVFLNQHGLSTIHKFKYYYN